MFLTFLLYIQHCNLAIKTVGMQYFEIKCLAKSQITVEKTSITN